MKYSRRLYGPRLLLPAFLATAALAAFQAIGAVSFDAGDGYYYEYVSASGIAWDSANAAANTLSYNGVQGHLAIVTSAAENAFVYALANSQPSGVPGEVWIGAHQVPETTLQADANWYWVNGAPVAGVPVANPTPGYSNWNGGEPNDNYGQGSEQWMGMWISGGNPGTWNDEGSFGNIGGYVVEFSPVPEPSTIIALAPVVLLVGASGLRSLRRSRIVG